MSRILRRPMFRGGKVVSSYGNGIASGLADNRVGLKSSYPGTVGQAYSAQQFPFLNSATGSELIASQKLKPYLNNKDGIVGVNDMSKEIDITSLSKKYPYLEEESINYISDNVTDDKTSKNTLGSNFDTTDELMRALFDDTLNSDFNTTGTPEMSEKTKAKFGNIFIGNEESRQKLKDLEAEEVELKVNNKNLNNKIPEIIPEIIPDIIPEKEEDIEVSAKDAIKANKELFAELLGTGKMRKEYGSNVLASISKSMEEGRGFKGAITDAAQVKSNEDKINQSAGMAAIKDYIGGKRTKEQADVYKGKLDYEYGKKAALVNVQPSDSAQNALFKIGAMGKVDPRSDAAFKFLIERKYPEAKVYREDKIKMKDLSNINKRKKLKVGYNIIEENGVKNIVIYDGKNVDIQSISEVWEG